LEPENSRDSKKSKPKPVEGKGDVSHVYPIASDDTLDANEFSSLSPSELEDLMLHEAISRSLLEASPSSSATTTTSGIRHPRVSGSQLLSSYHNSDTEESTESHAYNVSSSTPLTATIPGVRDKIDNTGRSSTSTTTTTTLANVLQEHYAPEPRRLPHVESKSADDDVGDFYDEFIDEDDRQSTDTSPEKVNQVSI